MRARRSGLAALVAATIVIGNLILAGPAWAEPVDDILNCRVIASQPDLVAFQIIGYGGTSDGCRPPTITGSLVCVAYMGATVPTSCVSYGAGETGPTNPVTCLPGIWTTEVYPLGAYGGNDPFTSPPLIVTTQPCFER